MYGSLNKYKSGSFRDFLVENKFDDYGEFKSWKLILLYVT